jgi:hypothetical protein
MFLLIIAGVRIVIWMYNLEIIWGGSIIFLKFRYNLIGDSKLLQQVGLNFTIFYEAIYLYYRFHP